MPAISKKNSQKRKTAHTISKAQVVVKGKGRITAKRDVIGGNLTIHGSQYSARQMSSANVSTPREFVEQLRQLQPAIVALKTSAELIPAQMRRVEGDIIQVIEQVQKAKPLPTRISETLIDAKDTMDKINGNVKSALELDAALGAITQHALRVFGA